MEKGILTASPHLDRLVVNGKEIATIDLDKFTHRYQFPATKFLLLGLIEKEQVAAVVGSDTTSIYVEAGGIIDLKELGDDIKSIAAKNGSIDIGGISSGKISDLFTDFFKWRSEIFSLENGMLTPTMKIKRHKVHDKFKERLEKLYDKSV